MTGRGVQFLIVFVSFYCGLNLLLAQTKTPAAVFRPALQQIQSKTPIPILLPSRLPSRIRERDIKLAYGEVREDGYFISLYFSDIGSDATYAAGFGASTRLVGDVPHSHRIKLAGGRMAIFSVVSCGGSCAPANLWWEQNGVLYDIQIKLPSSMPEEQQKKILVEAADASVAAPQN